MPPTRKELIHLIEDPVAFLEDDSAVLRRMALTALSRDQALANHTLVAERATDEESAVRAAAAEKLSIYGEKAFELLLSLSIDEKPTVREAVATAFGEIGSATAVDWLIDAVTSDPDRYVREAAVAALGAVGDQRALDTLLDAMVDGPPQVRRRAIAAITMFDDDRIEPALRRAALDRNPGVREAAEMVVGKQLTSVPPSGGTGELASQGGLRACEPEQDW
ncbi:MAG: hypothetical protein BMS9Abin20_1533 [Acidimicrobiia bacterium]|nr:MAG: hypothetical protein BMS9Abin20_1533 [Acidimicrobiia bacterium]